MISRLLDRYGVRRGPGALLLCLLLAADAVLVTLHVLNLVVGVPSSPYFWIDGDRGYGEFMQYVKMFWAALLLVGIWWKWRQSFWLASAIVVLYLLADDAMSLHERLRVYIPITVSPDFFVRENHVQELVYLLGVAFVLLVPLALAYRRTDAAARGIARRILEIFLAIAFFAVTVDFVHTFYEVRWYFELVAVIEDGGEMVVGSLLVGFLVSVTTVLWGKDETAATVQVAPARLSSAL